MEELNQEAVALSMGKKSVQFGTEIVNGSHEKTVGGVCRERSPQDDTESVANQRIDTLSNAGNGSAKRMSR